MTQAAISTEAKEALFSALKYLHEANSQANNKGDLLKDWFRDNLGEQVAVSFITERKQIGNRFKEQKNKLAPFTVFFFQDHELIPKAEARLWEYAYPELRAVFFFLAAAGKYELVSVHAPEKIDQSTQAVLDAFRDPSTRLEKLPVAVASAADAGYAVGDSLEPKQLEENPCGLVGIEDAMHQAMASILAGKHVLLMGPPGTAKTELAECLCQTFQVPFKLSTAMAEWTTFDTIGGYLTSLSEPGSTDLDFHLGIVSEAIHRNHWLIIDEFNRADMDKAFGELFTILLGKTIDLPFKKRVGADAKVVRIGPSAEGETCFPVKLSPSWRLVATMNSFDKASLARLSLALMRRFAIVHVEPPPPDAYSKLLNEAAKEHSAEPVAAYDQAIKYLVLMFASDSDDGLRGSGIEIGPAIPLDAIKYVSQRLHQDSGAPANKLVLEAITNYLFPQFEGRDDLHQVIMESLSRILNLDEGDLKRASDRLSIFTGFKPLQ